MDKIKVIHDSVGQTLTVWFGDPAKESVCEETTDEVVLMKDGTGRVIGFGLLHYVPAEPGVALSVERVERERTPSRYQRVQPSCTVTPALETRGSEYCMSVEAQRRTIAEKLRSLPPDRVAEVEDFIDFLRSREADRQLVRSGTQVAEASFRAVWDNPDDADYDGL